MSLYKKQTFNINILLGLPASGKSYWACHNFNKNTEYNHTGSFIVDLDKYLHYENGQLTTPVIYSALHNSDMRLYIGELFGSHQTVDICIDGLITGYEDLKRVIDTVLQYIENRCTQNYDVKLYIHQWNEDRETCIHNDIMRVQAGERKTGSVTTIRNHSYEYVQKEQLAHYRELSYIAAIKFERHTVEKITLYDTVFAPQIGYDLKSYYRNGESVKKTRYMYSESWSGGGTWHDYRDCSGTIEPDSPNNFDELDKLLEKICPNITYLQYKKIEKTCIEIDSYEENDYYGGSETRCRWKCDIPLLYDTLKEMNLISDYQDI